MTQDHFQTPPDPKLTHTNQKMTQKSWLGSRWNILFFCCPMAHLMCIYMLYSGLVMPLVRKYGCIFIENLNRLAEDFNFAQA